MEDDTDTQNRSINLTYPSDQSNDDLIIVSKNTDSDLLKREILCYLRLAVLAKHDDARETYIEDALALMRRIIEKANSGEI